MELLFSKPEDRLLRLAHKVVFIFDRRADRILSNSNANFSQFLILLGATRFPGVSQTEIARFLNLTTGTVSRTIDHLVKEKLLSRTTNPENRRVHTVQLTNEGVKRFSAMYTMLQEEFSSLIRNDVSNRELEAASGTLRKILVALDPDCAEYERAASTSFSTTTDITR